MTPDKATLLAIAEAQSAIDAHGAGPVAIALVLQIAEALNGRDRVVLTTDASSLGPRILEFAAALRAKAGD